MPVEMLSDYWISLAGPDRHTYHARAFTAPLMNGLWEVWLEFIPHDSTVGVCVSAREAVHHSRGDAVAWASRLTPLSLECALARALTSGPLCGVGWSDLI